MAIAAIFELGFAAGDAVRSAISRNRYSRIGGVSTDTPQSDARPKLASTLTARAEADHYGGSHGGISAE